MCWPQWLLRLLPLAVLVVALPLHAQGVGDGPGERARVIEEVIVSARRIEERIQDVPLSITALGGELLQDRGIENLHELAAFTPNVRYTTNACCPTVFIRGFGTPFAAGAFDPTVGIAIDELSIAREIYMSDPLFDIERFEVLRGPQGTLFGKNTPAGLFNISTVAPGDEYSGHIIGKVGQLGLYRVEAAMGGPVGSWGDVAQFRIALVDSKQAGDVRNTALNLDEPATEQQAARVKLALYPTDSLEVLLIASRADTDSRYFHIQADAFRPDTVEWIRNYDPRFEDNPYNHQNSINLKDRLKRETDLLQSNIRWRLGDVGWLRQPEIVAVAGVTGFDQSNPLDVDFSPADVLNLNPSDFDYRQKSIELRGSGLLPGLFGIGEVEFLLGVQYLSSDMRTHNEILAGEHLEEFFLGPAGFELATGMQPVAGDFFGDILDLATALGVPVPETPLASDGFLLFLDQQTASRSLFGRVAWSFLDAWSLSIGARYTSERKDGHLVNRCFDPGILCAALGIEEFDVKRRRQETDLSPTISLQYFPTRDLSLFVTHAQGFKSGGFNNFSFSLAGIEVDAEEAESWEVGAKGKLFSGSLDYAVTLFQTTVDDLQVQNTVGALVQVRNAASARSRGLEIEGQWLTPWTPLSMRASGALTDARFRAYPNAPAVASSNEESQDLGGRRMPFVPKRQFTLSPELVFPLVGSFSLDIGADLLYRGDFYLDSDLDPHTLEKAYLLVDGRIGVRNDRVSMGILVTNLTDKKVREYSTDSLVYPGGFASMQEFQRHWIFQTRLSW